MSIYTGTGNSEDIYNYAEDDEVYGLAGNDRLESTATAEEMTWSSDKDTMSGGDGHDTILGGYDDDFLYGDAENDLLDGGNDTVLEINVGYDESGFPIYEYFTASGGNDFLDGGTGIDTMRGGTGHDMYIVDNSADQIIEFANQGTDSVESTVSYTLSAYVEKLTLLGTAINAVGNDSDNTLLGNAANNVLEGGKGNDHLNGMAGLDTLKGGQGDDTYILDVGDSVIEIGNEGTDSVLADYSYTLTTNVENLQLTGTAAINGSGNVLNNFLQGNDGANSLRGGEGDDTLNGGVGIDTLIGGKGNDIYYVDHGSDRITELANEGTDVVYASRSYGLSANIEDLILTDTTNINGTGNTLNNSIAGNTGNNVLRGGEGNDFLDGGAGVDTFYGGIGDDIFIVDDVRELVYENSNEGYDTVQTIVSYVLSENIENLELTGVLNSSATGNSGDNKLTGNSAANQLDGKAGADTLAGGLGDDWYVVDNVLDVVIELANQGVDTVDSFVNYTLGSFVEHLVLRGTQNLNGVGNSEANKITGNAGNNQLSGGAGDDIFYASAGNDTISGGEGKDTVSYFGALSEMIINLATGKATAIANGSQDTLSSIEIVVGSNFGDVMTGNTGDNTFISRGGNDTIYGGGGFDTVSYAQSTNLGVVVNLTSLGDFETPKEAYSQGHYLFDGRDVLVGISGVIGSDFADDITGNHAANRLSGGKGGDYLFGGTGYLTIGWYYDGYEYYEEVIYTPDGDDWLEGGLGDDTLDGGDGQDTASYARANAAVEVNLAFKTASGGDGVDRLLNIEHVEGSAFDDTLTGDNLNNLLIGNAGSDLLWGQNGNDSLKGGDGDDIALGGEGHDLLEGGTANDTLMGNNGNDSLFGGSGIDVMVGGTGDDVYQVDNSADIVTENSNQGTDTVQSTISYTLGTSIERLELIGAASSRGIGNGLNNTLIGNNASNVLDGNTGVDTLIGGLGDDTYVLDTISDVVVEYDGGGRDTVNISSSYSLINTYLESIVLLGSSHINATGNNFSNTLTGNSGNNILDGGAESDIMTGGLGNDTYIVDHQYDSVIEKAGQGIDTVKSSVRYDAVGRDIENIILTGTANIDAIGNSLNNLITGNSGHNVLDGGTGADTAQGGLGNDSYIVGNALDVVVELANQGLDHVYTTVSYALAANIENITLNDIKNINATGNSLANVMTGNSGHNLLDGGLGIDTLQGGLGNDTYVIDVITDVIQEFEDQGFDTVRSFKDYTLGNHLEQLALQGSDDLTGVGNSLNNTVIGNVGNNIINGLQGEDILKGGLGDDRYYVDNVNDNVVEVFDAGNDSIYSTVSYSLVGRYVESLTLTGNEQINATGNRFDNALTGNSANNILDGGSGADTLKGGLGNDTYILGRTTGADLISENDSTANNVDTLTVLSGVAIDQLWFKHVGNNLEVNIIGRSDVVVIQDWYSGKARHIEEIRVTDGNKLLLDTKVEALVTAMAAVTPPTLGQTTLNAQQRSQLDAVIAASWS